MRSCKLPSGAKIPVFGIGTWRMGESARQRPQELDAVRYALETGYPMIDTAEMYGEGGAEEIVVEAIKGRPERPFIVSKVYPHNASRRGTAAACERSLRRLRTDRIDLYLLHWRGAVPLGETVDAFERLRAAGKIRRWGVSNFDTADMEELLALADGRHCAVNQVLYNLSERGIEWRLLHWCRSRSIAVMAYSPVAQGSLATNRKLAAIAGALDVTPAQIALAWVLTRPQVIAIPQSSNLAHIDANGASPAIRLDEGALAALDAAFPPPRKAVPLAMI